MFQSHFSRILNLGRRPPKQLAGRRSCHCTCHADLSLASNLGSGNGRIRTHHVAKQAGSRQRTQDTGITEIAGLFQMIKHSRHDTTRTASRGSHDLAPTGIFFGNSQSIRIDHPTAFDTTTVTLGTNHIIGSLTPNTQTTRQNTLRFQAITNRLLHDFPYFSQIIPYLRTFALFDILPEGMAGFFTPGLYILDSMHFIDLILCQFVVSFIGKRSASNTVNRPAFQYLTTFIKRLEQDTVRMERQKHLRFPNDVGLSHRTQYFKNCHIRHMASTCGRQTAIKSNIKPHSTPIAFQKHPRGTHRPHRMATGRSMTDPVYLLN